MDKHTPGFWRVDGPSAGNPNMGLWSVEGASNVANQCTLADARLIAAAPAMLSALLKIAENESDGLHMYTLQAMQALALAAIAKARGES